MSAPTLTPDWPSLSFLLFQLVAHWGNRDTPRPSPRVDVLAATLGLSAVNDLGPAPGLARVAAHSPYAAELVAAVHGWPAPAPGSTWPGLVTAEAHEANLRLLRQGIALASALLLGGGVGVKVTIEGGAQIRRVDPTTCRLQPWPFQGRRLTVRAWDPRAAAYRRWTMLPLGG